MMRQSAGLLIVFVITSLLLGVVIVTPPHMRASLPDPSLWPGGTTQTTLEVVSQNGFSGCVSLSGAVSPAPSVGSITLSFTPATVCITPTQSAPTAMTIVTTGSPETSAGQYIVTVSGQSSTIIKTLQVALTVNPIINVNVVGLVSGVAGTAVTINGTTYSAAQALAGINVYQTYGTTLSVQWGLSLSSSTTTYVWQSSSGLLTSSSGTITATTNGGITANYGVGSSSITETFAESGLPSGSTWGITVGSQPYSESAGSTLQLTVPTGIQYVYSPTIYYNGVEYQCAGQYCSNTVSASGTITAAYSAVAYSLTIGTNPSGGGTTNPAPGTYWESPGAGVSITATPANGYSLSSWSGSGSGSYSGGNNPATVTMNGPITETADFSILYRPAIQTALSSSSVSAGSSVYDSATLSGASSTAGGTVTYYYSTSSACTTSGATTVNTVTVTNGVVPSSSYVRFNNPGTYYWYAVYSGDANDVGATSPCEPLTVSGTPIGTQFSPTIQTALSLSSVTTGSSVYDSATLSGASSTAGGTVTYYYSTSNTCPASGATAVDTVTVTNGAVPVSSSVQFNTAGTYYWYAVYSGDVNDVGATSPCETLTVSSLSLTTLLSSASISAGGSVYDTASLSGGTNPTGTITFYYFIVSRFVNTCPTSSPSSAGSASVTGDGQYTSSTETFTAGTYYWYAHYSGDSNNPSVNSSCEPLTVTPLHPTIQTTLSSSSVTAGSSVYDSATLSGAYSSAGGTVTYYYSTSNTCPASSYTAVNTVYVTNGVVPSSTTVQFNNPGTYYWYAVYSGDANDVGATSPCEPLTVSGTQFATTIQTYLSSYSIAQGNSVYASVTLSGASSTAGGTVTYYYSTSNTCPASGATLVNMVTVTNGGVPVSSSVTFNSAGTYYWYAVYSGDANDAGATSKCATLTVFIPTELSLGWGIEGYTCSGAPVAGPPLIYGTLTDASNGQLLNGFNIILTVDGTPSSYTTSPCYNGSNIWQEYHGVCDSTATASASFPGEVVSGIDYGPSSSLDSSCAGTPVLSLNPTGTTVGSTVSWFVDGFPGSDSVNVYILTSGGAKYEITPATTLTTSGTGSGSFTAGSNIYGTDSVWVQDSSGQKTNAVTLIVSYAPLTASLSASPSSGAAPLTVTFSASASGGSGSYSYSWSGLCTPSGSSCTGTFTSAGTYSVSVTVVDSKGTMMSASTSVTIYPPFTVSVSANPSSGVAPLTVTFSASASGGSGSYSYSWSISCSVSGSSSCTHTFTSAGTYFAAVRVTDSVGDTASGSASVTVGPPLSVSASASPSSGDAPLTVTFSASASGGSGSYSYSWSGSCTGSGSTCMTTFSSAGSYSASVTATDSSGHTASNSATVTVWPPLSVSVSPSPSSGDAPLTVTFSASASGGSGSYSYSWSISCSVSGSSSCTHTFTSTGTLSATVTVTDSSGGTKSGSASVTVYSPPTVSVSVSPSSGPAPLTVTFSASASGGSGGYSYSWSGYCTGSGSTCTHTFDNAGTFSATVTVTDSSGGTASGSASVTVGPPLSVSASANPSEGDAPLTVTFSASASSGSGSYSYSWSGSCTGSGSTCTTTFSSVSSATTYSATVTVTDSSGHMASATAAVTVWPHLTASISDSISSSGLGWEIYSFTGYASGGSGGYSYSWSFGATGQTASHEFVCSKTQQYCSYTVTLTVTDSIGDTATASVTISVAYA